MGTSHWKIPTVWDSLVNPLCLGIFVAIFSCHKGTKTLRTTRIADIIPEPADILSKTGLLYFFR